MNRKIIRLYKNDFDKIDNFLKNNFSSPTHWQDWNNVISKYYNTEFFYFVIINDNNIIGVCPVHRIKNGYNYRLISGPKEFYLPFGGWIFSKDYIFNKSVLDLKINENLEIFSLPIIKEFKAGYGQYKLLKLFKTAIINLEKSENDLWNSLPAQRRNKIRKAKKNNVEILGFEEVGIDKFYDFYVLTNKQYGLKNLSKDFFVDLFYNSKNININVLFSKYNSEINGAVVIVSDKNYSIYWLGARLENAINTGYFDLLQWEAINKAKSLGCKYYDLCYLEKARLQGIYKFKSDYSNDNHDVLNINYKSYIYKIFNKFQKILL
jgi:hypothetical protein